MKNLPAEGTKWEIVRDIWSLVNVDHKSLNNSTILSASMSPNLFGYVNLQLNISRDEFFALAPPLSLDMEKQTLYLSSNGSVSLEPPTPVSSEVSIPGKINSLLRGLGVWK